LLNQETIITFAGCD